MTTQWFESPRISSLGFIAERVTRLRGEPPAIGVDVNRPLDPSRVPPPSAFTLVGAAGITVTKILLERIIVVELSAELPKGLEAFLSYEPPAPLINGPRRFDQAIRDTGRHPLPGFRYPIE